MYASNSLTPSKIPVLSSAEFWRVRESKRVLVADQSFNKHFSNNLLVSKAFRTRVSLSKSDNFYCIKKTFSLLALTYWQTRYIEFNKYNKSASVLLKRAKRYHENIFIIKGATQKIFVRYIPLHFHQLSRRSIDRYIYYRYGAGDRYFLSATHR